MKYLLLILLYLQVCNAQHFNWPTSTPDQQGVDSSGLQSATTHINGGGYGDIKSLVIIKNGKLIYQRHFSNFGQMAPVYSVTKSIGSALLGIAKFQGAEIDTSASIMEFMPKYHSINDFENKNNITVKDLLTQRHGLDWDEWSIDYGQPDNPISLMLNTSDWYKTVLEWPIAFAPDQKFAYSTGASSLMSQILLFASGETPQEFAAQNLFTPLDIAEYHWELIFANGSMGQGITSFPDGVAPLGFGIWLKPIDMAKIGELFRLDGVWQGQRLLSTQWVKESTTAYSNGTTDPEVFAGNSRNGYAYQWWTTSFTGSNNRNFDAYYANGYGRQYIIVIPDAKMVIVSTANDYFYNGKGIGAIIREDILPAVSDIPQGLYPITQKQNGSWSWPEHNGQGINIEVLNNNQQILAYWYTFNQQGQQRWLFMTGDINNDIASFEISSIPSGTFIFSDNPTSEIWGSGQIKFSDCYHGTFSFISESENVSGVIPITRFTGEQACLAQKQQKIHRGLGFIN